MIANKQKGREPLPFKPGGWETLEENLSIAFDGRPPSKYLPFILLGADAGGEDGLKRLGRVIADDMDSGDVESLQLLTDTVKAERDGVPVYDDETEYESDPRDLYPHGAYAALLLAFREYREQGGPTQAQAQTFLKKWRGLRHKGEDGEENALPRKSLSEMVKRLGFAFRKGVPGRPKKV